MVVHCPQEATVLHQYWAMIVGVEVGTVLHEGQAFYLCYDINLCLPGADGGSLPSRSHSSSPIRVHRIFGIEVTILHKEIGMML